MWRSMTRWSIVVLLTLVVFTGCSEERLLPTENVGGSGPVGLGTMTHIRGGLTRSPLEGIWISPTRQVFVVGAGVAFIAEGDAWRETPLPERNLAGIILRPWLYDVWGSADDDVYAVGRNGQVLHYDGTWSEMESPTSAHIHGVHGGGSDDVWIAAEDGLHRWDGSSWASLNGVIAAACVDGATDFRDVWVDTARERVIAVGPQGTIVTRTRFGWTCEHDLVEGDLLAVDGHGQRTVYAVGTDGAALHDAITGWQEVDVPGFDFYDVAVLQEGAYAVGRLGTVTSIRRFDGIQSTIDPDDASGGSHLAVAGFGTDLRVAVGESGLVSVRADTGWEAVFDGEGSEVYDVFGFPSGHAFAVGVSATEVPVWRFEGLNWYPLPPSRMGRSASGDPIVLSGIWGLNPDEMFVTTHDGTVYRFDGSRFDRESEVSGPPLHALWGFETGELFAVGDLGRIWYRNDELLWSVMSTPVSIATLRDVWGSSPDDVYAIAGSRILRYDGTEWSIDYGDGSLGFLEAVSGVDDVVFAVGGDVFTGGGVLARRVEEQWSVVARTPHLLSDVWAAAPDRVFVGGGRGTAMVFDGQTLHAIPHETAPDVNAIWGTSEADVHFVGAPGAFLRYQE